MYDREVGMPCILKRTGTHPGMMLHAMDEMFHVFWGVGATQLCAVEQHQGKDLVSNNVLPIDIISQEVLQHPQLCIPPSGLE